MTPQEYKDRLYSLAERIQNFSDFNTGNPIAILADWVLVSHFRVPENLRSTEDNNNIELLLFRIEKFMWVFSMKYRYQYEFLDPHIFHLGYEIHNPLGFSVAFFDFISFLSTNHPEILVKFNESVFNKVEGLN